MNLCSLLDQICLEIAVSLKLEKTCLFRCLFEKTTWFHVNSYMFQDFSCLFTCLFRWLFVSFSRLSHVFSDGFSCLFRVFHMSFQMSFHVFFTSFRKDNLVSCQQLHLYAPGLFMPFYMSFHVFSCLLVSFRVFSCLFAFLYNPEIVFLSVFHCL